MKIILLPSSEMTAAVVSLTVLETLPPNFSMSFLSCSLSTLPSRTKARFLSGREAVPDFEALKCWGRKLLHLFLEISVTVIF